MALPQGGVQRKKVTLSSGEDVLIRSLTRAEVGRLMEIEDNQILWEETALAIVLDVSVAEVAEWSKDTPGGDVLRLSNAVMELSGLGDTGKSEASNEA